MKLEKLLEFLENSVSEADFEGQCRDAGFTLEEIKISVKIRNHKIEEIETILEELKEGLEE